jgi:hypothetical protein
MGFTAVLSLLVKGIFGRKIYTLSRLLNVWTSLLSRLLFSHHVAIVRQTCIFKLGVVVSVLKGLYLSSKVNLALKKFIGNYLFRVAFFDRWMEFIFLYKVGLFCSIHIFRASILIILL